MAALLCGGLFAAVLLAPGAWAVIETYEFSSPELEARYHRLSQELRCPKCQNQNIADSNAPISEDLRRLLYRQLEAGASDEAILDDMVSRYGEFVRYRPGFDRATAVLWLAPAIFLALALLIAIITLRRTSARRDAGDALRRDERERLSSLLAETDREQ
jgi:cytochrome c-type biogenesis protein CcmH